MRDTFLLYIVAWTVTTDGVWVSHLIYWHFDTVRDYTLQFTITHTHTHQCPQSCLHYRCLVAASKGGRSPSFGFSNCSRPQLLASNSNSSQRLNISRPLTHSQTNSFTNWLTPHLSCLYLGTVSTQNTAPLLQCNCCIRVCWRSRYLATAVV
jgi:hypothetical protein